MGIYKEQKLKILSSELLNYLSQFLEKRSDAAKNPAILVEAILVQEYMNIAFADVSDLISMDKEDNVRVKNLKKLPKRLSCAIKEINQSGNQVKVKMHDKKPALDFIAKYFGIGSCQLPESDIEKRIFELLGKIGIVDAPPEMRSEELEDKCSNLL